MSKLKIAYDQTNEAFIYCGEDMFFSREIGRLVGIWRCIINNQS